MGVGVDKRSVLSAIITSLLSVLIRGGGKAGDSSMEAKPTAEGCRVWEPGSPNTEAELMSMLSALERGADGSVVLPDRPVPRVPTFRAESTVPMRSKLRAFQRYISSFEYNFTGVNYIPLLRKDLGTRRIVVTAKEIIRESLPIKCVEAVFLGCYLTMGLEDLDRVPIRFVSRVEKHTFKHIVLAVHHKGRWGALGLSRKDSLMWKDLTSKSLSALLLRFKESYEACWHELVSIGVGLPMSHDPYCTNPILWRPLILPCDKCAWEALGTVADRFAAKMHAVADYHRMELTLPAWFAAEFDWKNPEGPTQPVRGKPAVPKLTRRPALSRKAPKAPINEGTKGPSVGVTNKRPPFSPLRKGANTATGAKPPCEVGRDTKDMDGTNSGGEQVSSSRQLAATGEKARAAGPSTDLDRVPDGEDISPEVSQHNEGPTLTSSVPVLSVKHDGENGSSESVE